MNTKLKKQRNDFQKDFLKLMKNSVFAKTMGNVRRRNYIVPEPNYHTTMFFTEHLFPIQMRKS